MTKPGDLDAIRRAVQSCTRCELYKRATQAVFGDGPTDADYIDIADGGGSVFAGSGDDTILAGNGDDFLLGESGADLMISGAGNDALIAGPGNDTLEAGAGNDVIIAEGGDDRLTGGPGADLFRYPGGIAVNADRITDFVPADDTIELSSTLGYASAATALAAVVQQGADADITIVAPDFEREVRWQELGSYSDYSLYDGWRLKGWPRLTMVRGVTVMRDGQIVGPSGHGRYLKRTIEPASAN